MHRRHLLLAPLAAALLAAPPILTQPARAQARSQIRSSLGPLGLTQMAGGLVEPWGLAFLPDGRFLVTERGGRMVLHAPGGGAPQVLGGVPRVWAQGQGGLFDVVVARDFAASGTIWFSYAEPQGRRGAGTALAQARLSADGTRLTGLRKLWAMPEGTRGGRHFGGRIVEAPDGMLFVTLGDRGEAAQAQNPRALQGKVIRLTPAGDLPQDNPFVGQRGHRPEIWSLGHRNPQGATLDAAGQLWVSEHGARGGDEINRVAPGRNYGWPVISYGTDYDGSRIGTGTVAEGMEQPAHFWDPSIAPSGHVICSGRMWPEWAGHHLVGSLKFNMIARMDPARPGPGGWAEERMKAPETGRVRDLREAPDGSLWFLSVDRGAVFRIAA